MCWTLLKNNPKKTTVHTQYPISTEDFYQLNSLDTVYINNRLFKAIIQDNQ